MSIPVSNVDITVDTWGAALTQLNVLLSALSNDIITANASFSNTGTPGAQRNAVLYGKMVANTFVVATALQGGSNSTNIANLNITSNAIFTGALITASSNTQLTAANIEFKSNTTITAFKIAGNTTSTDTTVDGNTFIVSTDTMSSAANTQVTAANIEFKSNTTITAFKIAGNTTSTNTTLDGNTLFINTDSEVSAANTQLTAANIEFRSNTTVVAVKIAGNATSTNTTVDGNTLFINTDSEVSAANTQVTAANIEFKSNTTITAIKVSGNSTSTNVAVGGNTFTVTANVTLTGVSHIIGGNVNFDTGVLFVDSVNNRVGIGNTAPDAALKVTGTANLTGNVIIGGTATITGNASLAGQTTFNTEYVIDVSSNGNIGTSSAPRMIYSFPKATYRTGKLIVQGSRAGNNQIAELIVAHDNTTAQITVYGVVSSPASGNTSATLGTFTGLVNNANVEILMDQTGDGTAVKVIANLIK